MIKIFLRSILVVVMLLGIESTYGQNISQKSAYIHTDKPFYVSGEILWYSILLPAEIEDSAPTLEVNFFDKDGARVEQSFVEGKGQRCEGYYRIPLEIKTGFIRMAVYGTIARTGKEVLISKFEIPVYNDIARIDEVDSAFVPSNYTATTGAGEVKIALDRKEFGPRESVSFRLIEQSAENLSISYAVTDEKLIVDEFYGTLFQGLPLPLEIWSGLSEDIVYRGVASRNGAVEVGMVLDAYSISAEKGHNIITGSGGEFVLRLPKFYDDQPIKFYEHFQFLNDLEAINADEVENGLELDFTERKIEPDVRVPAITNGIFTYIERSKQRKKLYQLKNEVETSIAVEEETLAKTEIEPDRILAIGEYDNFPDLIEFFNDVSTPLKFKTSRKGLITAKMFRPEIRKYYTSPPLFIVDDQIFRDANKIFELNILDVHDIDLYYNWSSLRSQFALMGEGGVVRINTSKSDYFVPVEDDNLVIFSGLRKPSNLKSKSKDQLDFRPMIEWKGGVSANANITFNHSGDKGDFKITVVTSDRVGQIKKGEIQYTVK